jgi:putative ABC transport system ATP-binding protein
MFLRLNNIDKSFSTAEGPLRVLRGVSLSLEAGKSLALSGESGSGKSTLLHVIAGVDRADAGEIWLNERNIAALGEADCAALRRGTIGLVFQQFNLIPSLDAAANLAFYAHLSNQYDANWLETITERLGLSKILRRYPEQLSGGQQQRIAIGRTLAAKPQLVLADEPTGNLDEATGDAVLDLMLSMVVDTGAALIMATHSQRLANRLDHHLYLRSGQLDQC